MTLLLKKGCLMKEKLRTIITILKSYFKTSLPVGRTEFDNWATDIIKLSGSPDNDSIRFALANIILQLKADQAYQSKNYCANILRKGMANQVASAVFTEMKTKQIAALEAAKKAEEASAEQK